MRGKRNADLLIASIAARQFGVVARRQLLAAGVDRGAIDRRIARRTLHVVHRSVYAFGDPTLTAEGRWFAAVLACGPGAVLSHRAAGALWGLRPSRYLEVTVPKQKRTVRRIRIHRSWLPGDETTTFDGIPVSTVPRTLLDLAAVLSPLHLERAINEAEIRGRYDSLSLPDLLHRYPGRPGAPAIRAILSRDHHQVTKSELEERFVAFVDDFDLPRPETNASLQINGVWLECDCIWRTQRLVVELDGYAFHRTRAAFDADRARDRRLHAAGWRVLRITWYQLQAEAKSVARDLRAVLSRPSV